MFFTRILVGVALATSFHVFGQDARPVSVTKITGADEVNDVDTELGQDGKTRLLTSGLPAQGVDPQGTTWFYIGNVYDADGVGGLNDTVRVEIPAAVTPLNTIYPAVDVTTTVDNAILTDDNPERALALQICADLDADANFKSAEWDCQVIKDFSAIFIHSRLFNEFGTRTSWTLSSTGSTVVEQVQPDIAIRTLVSELSRSPNDPRKGTLAISGTVQAIVVGVGDRFNELLRESGGSSDMQVNGSGTPVDFEINCDTEMDTWVEEISFFGGCNGIKFGQFLCRNQPLATGVQVSMLSKQEILAFEDLKTTEDIKNYYAIGGSGPGSMFRLDVQSGADQFSAAFRFRNPQVIEKCGTNPAGDDYLRFRINDSLNSGLKQLEALAIGFLKEPE